MCKTAQTLRGETGIVEFTGAGERLGMLYIVALVIAAVLVGIVRARVPGGKDPHLGQMSHQWLAEYRAMHSS
jgi:UPF0716 family protein affecting phage T7 exclusion